MSTNRKDIGKTTDGDSDDGKCLDMVKEADKKGSPQRPAKRGRMETSPTLNVSLTDPGQRKESEANTPKNVSVISYLWDEEERRSIKKPREGYAATPGGERRNSLKLGKKMGDKVAGLIRSADKDLRETRRLVAENPNTKKEIKALIKSLSSIVSQLCTRGVLDNLEGQEEDKMEAIMIEDTTEAATQTERGEAQMGGADVRPTPTPVGIGSNRGQVETKEAEVQTDPDETPRPPRLGEYEPVRSLDAYDTISEWKEIVRRRWRPEAYTCTEIKESRNILETKNSVPKVILSTKKTSKQLNIEAWKRFPELLAIEEEYVVLEQTTNIKAGGNSMASCKVIRVITDESEENLWKNLIKIREETAGEERVAFLPLLGKTADLIRKMAECIFHNTETHVRLYVGSKEAATKKTVRQAPGRATTKEKDTCALVVEGDKKETYTDILKHVKEKVGVSTASSKIRGLRSTRDGRLLITMDKDEGAADRMMEILGETGGTLKVVKAGQRKREVTLHVRGMDALTAKQDVILAVEAKTGPLRGRTCKVSELRPNTGNTLAATLILEKEDADKLLDSGLLRIGWVNCPVEKRVEVARCYKCWEYTHKARDCKSNVDMSGKCYKCGEDGHNAKDCVREEFCPVCSRGGHKADSIKCPVFRRALWNAREKEREKRENKEVRQVTAAPQTVELKVSTASVPRATGAPEDGINEQTEQGPRPSRPGDTEDDPGGQEGDDEPGRGDTNPPHD